MKIHSYLLVSVLVAGWIAPRAAGDVSESHATPLAETEKAETAAEPVREAAFAPEEEPFDRFFVGAAGALMLPQGGGGHRHLGGAALRAGCYLNEFWAVEGEAAWLEDAAGLAADALWHWWGYERFDPFCTFGARGWIGSDGQVGPKAGVGAFYHLTDNLSLRFDADTTLGLDTRVEMLYTLAVGVQWSF